MRRKHEFLMNSWQFFLLSLYVFSLASCNLSPVCSMRCCRFLCVSLVSLQCVGYGSYCGRRNLHHSYSKSGIFVVIFVFVFSLSLFVSLSLWFIFWNKFSVRSECDDSLVVFSRWDSKLKTPRRNEISPHF